jgi:hypothetical protein
MFFVRVEIAPEIQGLFPWILLVWLGFGLEEFAA